MNGPPPYKSASHHLFLYVPFLIQIPYIWLSLNFDYPNILRQPPALILERFATGGQTLILVWFAFALSILPLLFGIAMLPKRLPALPSHATALGITSALVQIIGLLRWTFLVPLLANAHHASSDATQRANIEWIFLAEHQLFGTLLGEHLGQLMLACWTCSVALTPLRSQMHRYLGLTAALLFLLSAFGALATVMPALAPLDAFGGPAFLVWSLWCGLLGWRLRQLPAISGGRATEPSLHTAMQDARLGKSQKEAHVQ